MKMVDILYVGKTEFKQSVFGQKVVKGKKMTTVTERTVLKGPAKKKIRKWDPDEQRYRIFEVKYLQEGDKFYARNIQEHLAKQICDSSVNFEIVQRNGGTKRIKFLEAHQPAKAKVGDVKEFGAKAADDLIKKGVAEEDPVK